MTRTATRTATETTERNRQMIVELATRLLADPRIARSAAGASWTDAADLRHTLEALGEAAGFLGIATDEELAAFGIER